jgi:tetratricopeptide (TPR) repeat protein
MGSNSLLELAKKVIRKAGEVGLDAAGGYVCGPAWPYAKKMLSPVLEELERRYPKLFLVSEEAAKAAKDLSEDKALQELLQSGFAGLKSGQEQILAALVRHDKTLIEIGNAISGGFEEAGKRVEDAYANISNQLESLRLEIANLRPDRGKYAPSVSSVSKLPIDEIVNRANRCQDEAMSSVVAGEPDQAAIRLSEARYLIREGLQQEPNNLGLLVVSGFVEKTQAQVAQLKCDHEGYVTSIAEATTNFALALRLNSKDVGALNGMANIYSFHGMYDKAIELGTLATHIEPNYAAAVWDLALSLEAKMKTEGPQLKLVKRLKSVYVHLEPLMILQPNVFSPGELAYVRERIMDLRKSTKPKVGSEERNGSS